MPEPPTYQFTPSFSSGRGLERPSPVYQGGFLSPARPQARFPCILVDRAFKWIIYSPLFSTPIQNHQIDGDQNVSFLLQKSKLAFVAVVSDQWACECSQPCLSLPTPPCRLWDSPHERKGWSAEQAHLPRIAAPPQTGAEREEIKMVNNRD